jgi:hypothetical protein
MKKLLLLLIPIILVEVWLSSRSDGGGAVSKSSAAQVPATVTWEGQPPTLTLTGAEEIFKKAFWRRPDADDKIVNAVRYEWSDAGGLQRWQWFLVVKASPGLIRYLRDDNAFGLAAATPARLGEDVPRWFRHDPKNVERLQSPQSAMKLMFSKSDSTIYATASGRGFTRGALEPPPAAQGAPSLGRIPNTLPPLTQ